ncbi:hypothetical protein [Asaia lannensis]|uniref:hypothetical protein n=1 Tax=Asaia lannensis TaxID=415421 RepID=UPI0038731AA2
MSETIEAPAPAEETNILTGIDFGSDQSEGQAEAPSFEAPRHEPGTPGTEAEQEAQQVERKTEEPAWFSRRIGAITAKRREAEERAAQAEQELAEYRRALAAARGEEESRQLEMTPDQIRQQERESIATQEAQRRDVEDFGAATVKVADALAALHGREAITAATQSLIERSGLDFADRGHQQIIRDISELPNAGQVYYALANDPDAASALFDAPERRQYAMLQKFADGLTKAETSAKQAETPAPRPAPQISRTPAPVAAATGSARAATGGRSLYDPSLSAEDFATMLNKRS